MSLMKFLSSNSSEEVLDQKMVRSFMSKSEISRIDCHCIEVKKSLESSYPRPEASAFRPTHDLVTAISKNTSG